MKKVISLFMGLMFIGSMATAQVKPEAGDAGLGFHVSGLGAVAFGNWGNPASTALAGAPINDPLGIFAPGTTVGDLVPQPILFGRYYLASDLALRINFGVNSMSTKTSSIDTFPNNLPDTGSVAMDWKRSAMSVTIGAGIEKHFATSATRLDPYCGAELIFGKLGGITNETIVNNDFNTNINDNTQTVTTNWAGGSSITFNILGGFNYFFSDYFAIGAEVSWGCYWVGTGGDWTQTVVTDNPNNSAANSSSASAGTAKWSQSGFKVGSTSGVNASIFW